MIDVEGAGLWLLGDRLLYADKNWGMRQAIDVPRFKLPRGIFPAYREKMFESPLSEPTLYENLPIEPLPVVGRYVAPYQPPSAVGGVVSKDRAYFLQLPVHFTSISFDRIALSLTGNGGAGSVTRLGMYYSDGTDSLPGTVLVDAGTVVTSSGAAITREVTISQRLTRGWYWVVSDSQVGTAPTLIVCAPYLYFNAGNDSTPAFNRLSPIADGVTGAFANNPSTNSTSTGTVPFIMSRVSAFES